MIRSFCKLLYIFNNNFNSLSRGDSRTLVSVLLGIEVSVRVYYA